MATRVPHLLEPARPPEKTDILLTVDCSCASYILRAVRLNVERRRIDNVQLAGRRQLGYGVLAQATYRFD
jgi:hypothetical protein